MFFLSMLLDLLSSGDYQPFMRPFLGEEDSALVDAIFTVRELLNL